MADTASDEASTSAMPLIALVTGGLEPTAAVEIEHAFGLASGSVRQVGRPPVEENWSTDVTAVGAVFPGHASVAKLLFEVPWPVDYSTVRRLKSVQGLLAPVALARVSLGTDGLAEARAAVSDSSRWPLALEAWRVLTQRRQPLGQPSFRASAVRDGPHDFTSMDLARAVGGAVHTLQGWTPDMRGFELEVATLLAGRELVAGINVSATGFHKGMPQEPRPLLPYAHIDARLRPSTAWLMLRLARVGAGDVVLDPMCGIGTVPLEAAATAGAVLALGGDLDGELAWQAARNAKALAAARAAAAAAANGAAAAEAPLPLAAAAAALAAEAARDGAALQPEATPAWHYEGRQYPRPAAGGGAAVCHWSAAELPLRPGCVDAVVVDLPFGQTHKIKGGGARNLYPRALLEAARVLRPRGRFVALTPALRALTDCLESQAALWASTEAHQVNCGGILAWVVVWTRSHAPTSAVAHGAGSVAKQRSTPTERAPPPNVNAPFAPGVLAATCTDAYFYYAKGMAFDMSPTVVPSQFMVSAASEL